MNYTIPGFDEDFGGRFDHEDDDAPALHLVAPLSSDWCESCFSSTCAHCQPAAGDGREAELLPMAA